MILVLFVCWHKGKKNTPGSSSIVEENTALTEGNGPYSNPLKDGGVQEVQTHRDEREDETTKRGRGGTEGPHSMPH